jgi:nucleoid-associated protein YgaU
MQRRRPNRIAESLLFVGVATAAFVVAHGAEVFQPRSADVSLVERLRRLPSAIAAQLPDSVMPSRLPETLRLALSGGGAWPAPAEDRYIVRSGDTLAEIATRHDVTIAELVDENRLEDPDRLAVGQPLMIPVRGGVQPEPEA